MRVKKWMFVALLALVAVLVVGMGFMFNRQIKNETTATYSVLNWEVGNIQTTATDNLKAGQKISDEDSIRTSKLINADGLEITFKDNSEVTVKIHCYDKDGVYKGVRDVTNGEKGKGTWEDFAEGTEKVRVVILTGEKITLLNQLGYVNQITIKYNK